MKARRGAEQHSPSARHGNIGEAQEIPARQGETGAAHDAEME
jgi:hypothetical protein